MYNKNLKEYSNLFNNYHYVISMAKGDYNVKAKAKANKIIITTWEDKELVYTVTDNILEGTVPYMHSNLSEYLIDCIAQTQGVEVDKFYNSLPTFPNDENNFTLVPKSKASVFAREIGTYVNVKVTDLTVSNS